MANQKKRERERSRKPMHLRRVQAELRTLGGLGNSGPIAGIRLLLNDIATKGLGIYGQDAMTVGQEVSVTFEVPRQFYVKGKVIWCKEVVMDTHLIQQETYNFRVGIEFVFDSPEEEKEVEKFVAELNASCLQAAKPQF